VCGDDWLYFNGFCYKTNPSCLSWQAAQSTCLADNANLTSITSQEENTFVQHRHGGDTGWIGLQDINSEGNFTWIDCSVVDFTYWADNQPNNYPGDQDCVHTLGLSHDYRWNTVDCGSCHPYTCKRGKLTRLMLTCEMANLNHPSLRCKIQSARYLSAQYQCIISCCEINNSIPGFEYLSSDFNVCVKKLKYPELCLVYS